MDLRNYESGAGTEPIDFPLNIQEHTLTADPSEKTHAKRHTLPSNRRSGSYD